ncbi:hypothetical protein D5F51_20265 [Yersinia hibernica]|uniref:Uncharacterized protein n=1 Tax=Yersinia hibernica TaxID=2339259 RepID=A0ABX5R5L6_9GAMM|nr:hypothetical protein D5F51_20265 [Yersinia hibernica]
MHNVSILIIKYCALDEVNIYIIRDETRFSVTKQPALRRVVFIQNDLTAQGYHLHRYRKSSRYIVIIETVVSLI